mmetsp:Transcript_20003/g.38141  ORF Transcript_20003/g.38141 Transcript_20003/m.38141 type:complete len:216 (-) Transcript_20003:466-1113(-)
MQGHAVHAAQVTMVVANHLVVLEVPALDHLVQTAGEHVRVARAHRQPRHLLDMPRQRQLELPRGQVPDLDGPVSAAGAEPFVPGIHRYRAHPSEVPGDDAVELPRRAPLRLGPLGGHASNHRRGRGLGGVLARRGQVGERFGALVERDYLPRPPVAASRALRLRDVIYEALDGAWLFWLGWPCRSSGACRHPQDSGHCAIRQRRHGGSNGSSRGA